MTIGDALRVAAERLAGAGVETPDVDAALLLGDVLGLSRTQLVVERDRTFDEREAEAFEALVKRREGREPVAYILGEWGFRRLTLKTDRRALIPRPETEVLVERCLAVLAPLERPRVLDVGVGSGAIALGIVDERPDALVTGVDTSPDALALARENAERVGLRVEFREAGLEAAASDWDLVVSNPPYVAPADFEALAPEIRDWEPRSALVGEGLHGELARVAQTTWLVLEVGDGQAPSVAATLRGLGYGDVTITRDLAGRERIVEGRRR